MGEYYKYLTKLEKTYSYLRKKYTDELNELDRKINLEKHYVQNRAELMNTIYHLSGIYDQDTRCFEEANIRGGVYKQVIEHCQHKNSQNVVMLSYLYEGAKYIFYLYDSTSLIYMNNKKIDMDETNYALFPVVLLLKLLDGDAKNYFNLHKSNLIFRWGSPEEHGLD